MFLRGYFAAGLIDGVSKFYPKRNLERLRSQRHFRQYSALLLNAIGERASHEQQTRVSDGDGQHKENSASATETYTLHNPFRLRYLRFKNQPITPLCQHFLMTHDFRT